MCRTCWEIYINKLLLPDMPDFDLKENMIHQTNQPSSIALWSSYGHWWTGVIMGLWLVCSYSPTQKTVMHCVLVSFYVASIMFMLQVPLHGNFELRPLGVATGNAFSVTRVWRYICKNTIRWPATTHDVTTGATIIKGPPGEYIISFSSSSLTGLFEETCILVGIQFSFIFHGEH